MNGVKTKTFFAYHRLGEEIAKVTAELREKPRVMEVCGTHTVSIFRHGLRQLLKDMVELVSGPGCPVCVTPDRLINAAVGLAREGWVIATFGDMIRVPGSDGSLARARMEGADIRVVVSPLEVTEIACRLPNRRVLFLAAGFETTAPGTALLIHEARQRNIKNLRILSAHRLIPPALGTLLGSGECHITGLLCPGHVAAVTGTRPFLELSRDIGVPMVVAGFEPEDILHSILMILHQVREGRAEVINQYTRAVRPEGNPLAQQLIQETFVPVDSDWRGLGVLRESGLELQGKYQDFAALLPPLKAADRQETVNGCRCGYVLRGLITPEECPLFAGVCRPETPQGPCMVSGEGICRSFFLYATTNC